MDLLFHKISEKEREEIKKQVDYILKFFSEKLSKVDGELGESSEEIKESERDEKGEASFISRKIIFENAPEKSEDSIIAERKTW